MTQFGVLVHLIPNDLNFVTSPTSADLTGLYRLDAWFSQKGAKLLRPHNVKKKLSADPPLEVRDSLPFSCTHPIFPSPHPPRPAHLPPFNPPCPWWLRFLPVLPVNLLRTVNHQPPPPPTQKNSAHQAWFCRNVSLGHARSAGQDRLWAYDQLGWSTYPIIPALSIPIFPSGTFIQ